MQTFNIYKFCVISAYFLISGSSRETEKNKSHHHETTGLHHSCGHAVPDDVLETHEKLNKRLLEQNITFYNLSKQYHFEEINKGNPGTYKPIRIKFDFKMWNDTSSTPEDRLKFETKIFPSIKEYFEQTLMVYPLTENVYIQKTCFGIPLPDGDVQNGYPGYDHVTYVLNTYNASTNFRATSNPCTNNFQKLRRPVSSFITINLAYLNSKTPFQFDLSSLLHEFLHNLGFSFFNLNYYVTEWGQFLSLNDSIRFTEYLGQDILEVTTKRVLETARTFFDCQAITGVPFENEGTLSSLYNHWEATILREEVMTSQSRSNSKLSNLTLALLDDSGWYVVNYTMSQTFNWGHKKGCSFFFQKCQSNLVFDEFCELKIPQGCTYDFTTKAKCLVEAFTDGCYIYSDNKLLNCKDPSMQSNIYSKEKYGPSSYCIVSDYLYVNFSENSNNNRCYQQDCFNNATGGNVLRITLDVSEYYDCYENQKGTYLQSKNSLFKGGLYCPDVKNFCENFFQEGCKNNCDSVGVCLSELNCFYSSNGMNIFGACSPTFYLDPLQNCVLCNNPENFKVGSSNGTGLCYVCSENCLKCENGTACSLCKTDYFLNQNKQCVDCISEGFYKTGKNDGSGKCEACLNGCAVCSEPTYCVSCFAGFNLNSAQSICNKCESTCSDCDPETLACSKCKNTFYILPNKTCSSCISPSFFASGLTDGSGLCKSCSLQCEMCTSETTCLQCAVNYYLENNGCKNCTADGYIIASSTNGQVCKQCTDNCLKCMASTTCSVCQANYFLKETVQTCSKCEEPGYYKKAPNCLTCMSNCINCTDKSNCFQCQASFFIHSTLGCVACDTDGFFKSGGLCLNCPKNCKTCKYSNFCDVCLNSYYLFSGSCVECNLSGQFKNTIDNTCVVCADNCITCSTAKACARCLPNYYIKPDGKCSTCNSDGEIKSDKADGTGYCQACPLNCKSCTSTSICAQCLEGFYKGYIDKSYCTNCNLAGNFKTGPNDGTGVCLTCPKYCLSCNTNGKCYTCQSGYFLNEATELCESCTDAGKFISGNICSLCEQNCSKCLSKSECLKCNTSYYIDNSNQCVKCDKIGQYLLTIDLVTQSQICLNCPLNCDSCFNNNTCSNCATGYYKTNHGRLCSKCNSGDSVLTLININTYYCYQCFAKCQNCDNTGLCYECDSGLYPLMPNRKSCVPCNGNGEIILTNENFERNFCYKCGSSCEKCLNSTYCSQCLTGYYNKDGLCVFCDQPGERPNEETSTCEVCTGDCSQCTSIDNCLSCSTSKLCQICKEGFYKTVENADTITCSLCKKDGFYLDDISSICYACNHNVPNCLYCYKFGLQCYQCEDNYYLKNTGTECVKCAEEGVLRVGSEFGEGQCITCEEEIRWCKTCVIGNFGTECTSCQNSYYVKRDSSFPSNNNKMCVPCNLKTQIIRNDSTGSYCEPCENLQPNCDECNINANVSICQKCKTGYALSLPEKLNCIACMGGLNFQLSDDGLYCGTRPLLESYNFKVLDPPGKGITFGIKCSQKGLALLGISSNHDPNLIFFNTSKYIDLEQPSFVLNTYFSTTLRKVLDESNSTQINLTLLNPDLNSLYVVYGCSNELNIKNMVSTIKQINLKFNTFDINISNSDDQQLGLTLGILGGIILFFIVLGFILWRLSKNKQRYTLKENAIPTNSGVTYDARPDFTQKDNQNFYSTVPEKTPIKEEVVIPVHQEGTKDRDNKPYDLYASENELPASNGSEANFQDHEKEKLTSQKSNKIQNSELQIKNSGSFTSNFEFELSEMRETTDQDKKLGLVNLKVNQSMMTKLFEQSKRIKDATSYTLGKIVKRPVIPKTDRVDVHFHFDLRSGNLNQYISRFGRPANSSEKISLTSKLIKCLTDLHSLNVSFAHGCLSPREFVFEDENLQFYIVDSKYPLRLLFSFDNKKMSEYLFRTKNKHESHNSENIDVVNKSYDWRSLAFILIDCLFGGSESQFGSKSLNSYNGKEKFLASSIDDEEHELRALTLEMLEAKEDSDIQYFERKVFLMLNKNTKPSEQKSENDNIFIFNDDEEY